MNTKKLIICKRCVMDQSVPGIIFDENGFCNYCRDFKLHYDAYCEKDNKSKNYDIEALVKTIKSKNQKASYDCIIGLSGGVDSAWSLHTAVKHGLRPLAVHMDNGWNSELAQNNIENLVRSLEVDLYTHVIDWSEYKRLMQAFFDTDVIDIELLYDNAMLAVNYNQAKSHNIHWILSGSNTSTEGMRMPDGWNWFKYDAKNIKSIARSQGIKSFKTFPLFSLKDFIINEYVRKINWLPFLDYIDYSKDSALDYMELNYAYKRYPYKHYESIFTRFYQGYILPKKFNVDKRKLHFSTLIITRQLERGEAIEMLNNSPYESKEDLEIDKEYFLKKMGWSNLQFNEYMNRKPGHHDYFRSDYPFWKFLVRNYRKWIS
tara:strand:- start:20597 stop:21718 length:1122 start_codon:yes stop_codon:yes gene_type:complete